MPFSIPIDSAQETHRSGLLNQKPRLLRATVALLFLLGLAIRVYFIQEPGVVPDRQYRSFLIARAYYFEMSDAIPEWRKNVASTSSQRQESLEPQITERIVGLIYRLVNGDHWWIARLVASFFWLIGGIPLYLLAKRIGSGESAVISTAYYLLVPYGVLLSLSFLPEPLMIMMLLFSLLAIVRYYEKPSHLRLLFAGSISGLAILIKPFVVFIILGAFLALAIYEKRTIRRILDFSLLIFATVSLLPGGLFYGYGILGEEYLRWKVETSFLPHFFLSRTYWEGWFLAGTEAVGFAPLLIALLGLPMLQKGESRPLVVGLGAGYVAFCLSFNYFIHFLAYYHAQLIVIVALSIGPILALLAHHLRTLCTRWYAWAPVFLALMCIAFFNIRSIQRGHIYPQIEGEEIASEIGELVNHSNRVAYLSYVYGLPLEYYGELAGEYWPRPAKEWPLQKESDQPLSIEERIELIGFSPEYFVVTQFEEYKRYHSDLKNFLETNGSLVAQRENYLIYKMPRQNLPG